MPLTDKFTFYMGDGDTADFTLREDGANKVMTGLTARFVGKTGWSAGATEYVFDVACTDLGSGRVRATLSAADLATDVTNGICEMVIVQNDGSHRTWDQWGLVILPDVYRGN